MLQKLKKENLTPTFHQLDNKIPDKHTIIVKIAEKAEKNIQMFLHLNIKWNRKGFFSSHMVQTF